MPTTKLIGSFPLVVALLLSACGAQSPTNNSQFGKSGGDASVGGTDDAWNSGNSGIVPLNPVTGAPLTDAQVDDSSVTDAGVDDSGVTDVGVVASNGSYVVRLNTIDITLVGTILCNVVGPKTLVWLIPPLGVLKGIWGWLQLIVQFSDIMCNPMVEVEIAGLTSGADGTTLSGESEIKHMVTHADYNQVLFNVKDKASILGQTVKVSFKDYHLGNPLPPGTPFYDIWSAIAEPVIGACQGTVTEDNLANGMTLDCKAPLLDWIATNVLNMGNQTLSQAQTSSQTDPTNLNAFQGAMQQLASAASTGNFASTATITLSFTP